ncbi:histone-lysine N-methyltransferase SETMAR [Trichonephila clavipes]|nr:histone-lysine N-methyltransferase SETMAR [Trichonephila clavipes]
MEWQHTFSPVKIKVKQSLSKHKLMATVFWEQHSVFQTQELIKSFPWKVLDHAPYSPDLDASDFHFFRYLKHSIGGKRFRDNEEVEAVVNSWLSDQATDFFEEGFKNLVLRNIIMRHIDEMGQDVGMQIVSGLQNYKYFSLTLDESCDITDNAQLNIFVHYISNNFDTMEELLDWRQLVLTTEMEENGELLLHCSVHQLSKGSSLARFWNVLEYLEDNDELPSECSLLMV